MRERLRRRPAPRDPPGGLPGRRRPRRDHDHPRRPLGSDPAAAKRRARRREPQLEARPASAIAPDSGASGRRPSEPRRSAPAEPGPDIDRPHPPAAVGGRERRAVAAPPPGRRPRRGRRGPGRRPGRSSPRCSTSTTSGAGRRRSDGGGARGRCGLRVARPWSTIDRPGARPGRGAAVGGPARVGTTGRDRRCSRCSSPPGCRLATATAGAHVVDHRGRRRPGRTGPRRHRAAGGPPGRAPGELDERRAARPGGPIAALGPAGGPTSGAGSLADGAVSFDGIGVIEGAEVIVGRAGRRWPAGPGTGGHAGRRGRARLPPTGWHLRRRSCVTP